jgi:uncharacterized protein YkwD
MRIFAWIGGLAVLVLLGALAVSAVGSRAGSERPVAATQPRADAIAAGLPLADGLFPPSPSPQPSAPTRATPAPAKPSTSSPIKAPPRPSIVVRSTQQSLINQDRARYHLAALTWSTCLYNVARYEAAHLAEPGVAFQHYDGVTRDLACHLGRKVGENIGWYSGGINDTKLNNMFMDSAEHKANILGPYRYVATAWVVRSDGRAFIAVEFG